MRFSHSFIPIALIWVSLFGCAFSPTFRDELMSDGNTWRIQLQDFSGGCGGYTSSDDCMKALVPKITRMGQERCNRDPYRVFGCGVIDPSNIWGKKAVSCNVQCKESPKQDIEVVRDHESSTKSVVPSSSGDENLLKKAKICQKKGGVWVNNMCVLDIDTN
jgi:hypothetical protein